MSFVARCPCGQRFEASEHLLNKPAKCPSCGQTFVVGGGEQPMLPPARANLPTVQSAASVMVVSCSGCQQQLQAQASHAGMQFPCPGCGESVLVPRQSQPVPQATQPLAIQEPAMQPLADPQTDMLQHFGDAVDNSLGWQAAPATIQPATVYAQPGYGPKPSARVGGSKKSILLIAGLGITVLLLLILCGGSWLAFRQFKSATAEDGEEASTVTLLDKVNGIVSKVPGVVLWERVEHKRGRYSFSVPPSSTVAYRDTIYIYAVSGETPEGAKYFVKAEFYARDRMRVFKAQLEAVTRFARSRKPRPGTSHREIPDLGLYSYEAIGFVHLIQDDGSKVEHAEGARFIAEERALYTVQWREPPGRAPSTEMKKFLASFDYD